MLNRRLAFLTASGIGIVALAAATALTVPAAAQDNTATATLLSTPIDLNATAVATDTNSAVNSPVPTDITADTETAQATSQPIQPTQPSTASAVYVVQRGDDLFRISLKFGLSIDALSQANGIVNPNVIYVGQKLILPGISPDNPLLGSASPATPAATTSVGATTVPATPTTELPLVANSGVPATYTVQRGDTLYNIAVKYNTTVALLAQLNHLFNPNLIYVGQVLELPTSGTASGTTAAGPASTEASVPPESTSESAVGQTPTPEIVVSPTMVPTTIPSPAATGSAVQGGASGSTSANPAAKTSFAAGVVADPGSDPAAVAKHVTALGATWIKQIVSWKTIETTQGSPDFTALDAAVNAYSSAHLHILLTLTNAPDWARASTVENGPPTDLSTFATFAGSVAARYQSKVSAYEIWNEPNLRRNWNGSALSAASYVEMLRLAFNAIKAANNKALVISAGLAPTGFYDGVNAIADRVFLKQEYLSGLASYADALGVHPSGWANPPDSTCCNASPGVTGWYNDRSFYFSDTLADYRQIMKDNNDTKKLLWITAFGWGSSDGVASADSVNSNAYGFVNLTTAAEQAQYLVRGYEIARALKFVGPAFTDNLNGCASAGDPASDQFYPCYYSLLDASDQPRPSYQALQASLKRH